MISNKLKRSNEKKHLVLSHGKSKSKMGKVKE